MHQTSTRYLLPIPRSVTRRPCASLSLRALAVSMQNAPRQAARNGVLPHRAVKAIEAVRAGDLVWAWDPRSRQPVKRQVRRTFRHAARPVLRVVINCVWGREQIAATPEHPFWVKGRGWTAAHRLRAGDLLKRLMGSERDCAYVVTVEFEDRAEEVFNFEVHDCHSYYVGHLGVLVHNSSGPVNLHHEIQALGSPSGHYRKRSAASLVASASARNELTPFGDGLIDVRGRRPAATGKWKDFYPTHAPAVDREYAVLAMKESAFKHSGDRASAWMASEVDYIRQFRAMGYPFTADHGLATALTDKGARPAYVLELAPHGAVHSKLGDGPNPDFTDALDLRAVPQLRPMVEAARVAHEAVRRGQVPAQRVLVDPQAFAIPASAKRGALLFQDPFPLDRHYVGINQTQGTLSTLEWWLAAAERNGLPGVEPRTGRLLSPPPGLHVVRPGVNLQLAAIGDKLVLQRYRYRAVL